MTLLVFVLALALWLFGNARQDAYSDINTCDFDDSKERLKELEAAFAAGMMTPEEFQRLSDKLGGDTARPVSGVSSRKLPKTWEDVPSRKAD